LIVVLNNSGIASKYTSLNGVAEEEADGKMED